MAGRSILSNLVKYGSANLLTKVLSPAKEASAERAALSDALIVVKSESIEEENKVDVMFHIVQPIGTNKVYDTMLAKAHQRTLFQQLLDFALIDLQFLFHYIECMSHTPSPTKPSRVSSATHCTTE